MKTNRHILNASNLFLALKNDEQLDVEQKLMIASCIESMLLEFYEYVEYGSIKDMDVSFDLFKDRVITLIENFNNDESHKLKPKE